LRRLVVLWAIGTATLIVWLAGTLTLQPRRSAGNTACRTKIGRRNSSTSRSKSTF
jgi:hypothetical protein